MTSLSARDGENRREKYEQQTRAHYHRRRSLYIETTAHAYVCLYIYMHVCVLHGSEKEDEEKVEKEEGEEINIGRLLDILCAHGAYKSFLVSGPSHTHTHHYYYLLAYI